MPEFIYQMHATRKAHGDKIILVATHILAWEGDDENPGRWYWFEGNFETYQENRVARLGVEAAKPHRVHRKLTRD